MQSLHKEAYKVLAGPNLVPLPSLPSRTPHHLHAPRRNGHIPSASSSPQACSSTSAVTQEHNTRHHTRKLSQFSVQPSLPASAQHGLAVPASVCTLAFALFFPDASQAIAAEPSNALSLPTWAIHVSCVIEWATAMTLLWQYAEVSGNSRWKGLAWGLLPCFGSAMCACTWHFFYNAQELEYLVALQAFLTLVGNCTCMVAGYRIWSAAKSEREEKAQV